MKALEKAIKVPEYKLIEMAKNAACNQISEGQSVNIVRYMNKEFVITGTLSSGRDGIKAVWGCIVKDLAFYKGKIEPLDYWSHREQVNKGKRERGYVGQIVKSSDRTLVMCEEFTFVLGSEGKQLPLF